MQENIQAEQTEFIREALRIGVHALDLATSRAESERLRDTGDQFLKEFQGSITTIQETVETNDRHIKRVS